ncbi:MAG: cyclodeaminase/cyclohydrolase family protein [Erysipelotrichaceae bacterium]|nr:cyclodeaminase/cyclohydrolase family protein [Erysipelotrichaceae bacterium]
MYNRTLDEFTLMTSSKEPVPGGGGVCALCASLASSLNQMVTNLTIGKKKYLEYTDELNSLKEESEALRVILLNCINEDAKAFEPLSKAYSADKNDPDYYSNMEECLRIAANSPFQILKYTTKVIDICERLSEIGSKIVVSDAGTAVMLASGVLYGTYLNIIVNTKMMKDEEYRQQLEDEAYVLLNEYSNRSMEIYEKVKDRIYG